MMWKRYALLTAHRAFRNIRMQYGGPFGAVVWMFLNPAVMFCIYYFAVAIIFKLKIDKPYGFGEFLFCGIWVWTSFCNALTKSTTALVNEGPILKKVFFSPMVLVPSIVLEAFIGLTAGLFLFLLYRLTTGFPDLRPIYTAVFLIPLTFFLALFTTGLGWLFSVLNVYWRDLTHFINILLTLWFYATPIIYPPELIPDKWEIVLAVNPAHTFIVLFREIMLNLQPGSFVLWLAVISFSLTFFLIGITFMRVFYPRVIDFL
ncbi:ABC transporter permease [Thermodesulforhabdus norvegica]|uniref:Transport permease protein n=1 Tax=Thermodesulforhabdus norvegica TaxID=39841 RepID=A0A1I4V029_9BACT|nr:ABC transporter permease [Thermodesulforhabdus norvegica]SFM94584.1 ABC-type polysaccharide/polyol phosphate export permease [Thermodesulforhabdus norvegica]